MGRAVHTATLLYAIVQLEVKLIRRRLRNLPSQARSLRFMGRAPHASLSLGAAQRGLPGHRRTPIVTHDDRALLSECRYNANHIADRRQARYPEWPEPHRLLPS